MFLFSKRIASSSGPLRDLDRQAISESLTFSNLNLSLRKFHWPKMVQLRGDDSLLTRARREFGSNGSNGGQET